ncbi:hypothetical protein [Parabacteroides pacaensis]|uniref:hypothetical protein n=1 Tax=Parabacteroides pacaensis TaxID=2086575 RepID=UPI001F45343D|nr:hypothetical protein [Parabacteroides pacaensis]
MKRFTFMASLLMGLTFIGNSLFAQITERQLPAEWNNLVNGGRFMDRFLPMKGTNLSSDIWGASCVKPRFIDNGIEDCIWSYWGGNIVKADYEQNKRNSLADKSRGRF